MVRALLVQPPHRDTFGYSMPPLGPLHIGAAARARGHEIEFLDFALFARRGELPLGEELVPACAARIAETSPPVLGIGAMISSMPAALHLAAEVKRRRPETVVLLGGQGPETVEEAVVARHPAVDAVAVGEADVTFPECLDALDRADMDVSALADVAGLVVRRDGDAHRTAPRPQLADLDDVAPPAWDLAESPRDYAAAAGGGEALFPIDLGRGCTFACTFCTTPVFWGRTARLLSPSRAVDELDRLASLDGIGCAYVTHDLFTVDRDRVLAICREKIARGNELPWECRTRLDLVDDELLTVMGRAGCRRILYGVESDSPRILSEVNKGGTSARLDVRERLRMASDVGMASILGVMCGVPGETADDVEANLTLMADAAVIDGVSLSMHWFNVTPGNGCADRTEGELALVPGLTADLVRGWDLPVGHVPDAQRRLVEDDPEIFAAFRVSAPPHASPRDLYLLSRNAHLLLEVLPRTTRAVAHARGRTLLETLLDFLRVVADEASADAGVSRATAGDASRERGVVFVGADDRREVDRPGDVDNAWDEPLVLRREAAVRRFADDARRLGDPAVSALADYELALMQTESRRLARFDRDPLELVRAMDEGRWPPEQGTHPAAVLFTRAGDAVRAHAVSPFLADAAEEPDDERLCARWPACDAETLARARRLLAELG